MTLWINATDLNELASQLLLASAEALDTIPVADPGLGGVPDRQFVSPGQPALDCCDQLTVYVAGVNEAATTPGGLAVGRRVTSARINLVTLVVTITRCLPTQDGLEAPPVDGLEATAAQISADAWALWNHLWNLWQDGDLFSFCQEVFWDGLRPVAPSGGCVGWTLTVRAALQGYQE